MFLIMSAAYVGQELESEFGQIPPSFLPLGNRRLFQYQIALAPKNVDVLLSIPESFSVSTIDQLWLEDNNITVIKTPEKLSLGASLVAAVNISGHCLNKPLHVLYGDTLYRNLPTGDDIATISEAKGSYHWATVTTDSVQWLDERDTTNNGGSQTIIDGYFKFGNPRQLVKNITQSEWDFIEGLNRYHQEIGLTPIVSDGWLDFGHVNTYYNSKAEFTTQRAFNELTITPNWVEKSSVKSDKIAAEANWFENLPYELRGHIPQYLGRKVEGEQISYRLEYLHLTALNELFVFSKLPSRIWLQIFSSCIDFLSLCQRQKSNIIDSDNSLDHLFGTKTQQRLSEYCLENNITLDDEWQYNYGDKISLRKIMQDSVNNLPTGKEELAVLHGDFCFSNILYDFRAGKVKTIDPRGITYKGNETIYGDFRYDIAKLSHSILGLYDWIIAGYFHVEVEDKIINFELAEENGHKETQYEFIKLIEKEFKLSAKNLYAMQIQLFLSMLPLHSDDINRQNALFANTFRLHGILTRLTQ